VRCIRRERGPKRWLWLGLTVVGVGKLAVNWTTGLAFLTPIFVSFPPAGATAPLYGPWTVYVSVPFGAIAYLLFHTNIFNQAQSRET
jgi:hypothetical protein